MLLCMYCHFLLLFALFVQLIHFGYLLAECFLVFCQIVYRLLSLLLLFLYLSWVLYMIFPSGFSSYPFGVHLIQICNYVRFHIYRSYLDHHMLLYHHDLQSLLYLVLLARLLLSQLLLVVWSRSV